MSKDTLLIGKLKECLQDAVVFLRTLGDFKIPAVVERRRKELLERLIDVQGDTRRSKPPKIDDGPAETPPVQKKMKEVTEKDASSSESSSTVTSPRGTLTKRDSKIVNTLVKDFEVIHTAAKKEEEEQTPKRLFELKKSPKPQDFPEKDNTPEPEPEPEATSNEPSTTDTPPVVLREKSEDSNELKPERPSSAASMDSVDSNDQANSTPKHKRKGGTKLGGFFKRKGRDKSPRRDSSPVTAVPVESEANDGVESESVEIVEEGVRISGKLEQKTKSALKTKYVPKDVKLKDTTLFIGDKDSVSIQGCTVTATDTGFELFSKQLQKQFVFRVDGGDEGREKWVNVLKEAIVECAPPDEEPSDTPSTEPVPTITVEVPVAPSKPVNEEVLPQKKRKESKALEVKSEKVLPKHGVEIQGNIHRKKSGIGTRWEKTYCVVTYESIYFTTVEDRGEYNYMLSVIPDGTTKISEKDKGHDRQSKAIVIKSGKKTEQLSIETKDGEFDRWNEAIKRVYCVGGVEELGSEEEEAGEIDEDLYEDVSAPPPIPGSPRPSRPDLPEVPIEDDFLIDEDIYEDTDDLDLSRFSAPLSSSPSTAPSLPDRNPPKIDNIPQPKLPPRNVPTSSSVPQPQLPPRNAPALPSRDSLPKPAAPIPTTTVDDEEIYDDIVPAADEETYDDVVVAPDGIEEDTYDDVVVGAEPITEEYYEDMVPGAVDGPQEDYVVMEHGGDDGDDLYVDVDHEPPPPKIVTPPPATSKPVKSGTFSLGFSGKSKAAALLLMGGSVSYRAPKKSKFEEKHATVEDTALLVYKTSTDKKHQEKIALSDCGLELGSTEAGAGEFAFRVSKGSKVHHFSVKTKKDLDNWLGVLTKLVKYAPVTVDHGDQQIYQASQDHIAETDGELTFKKGSFIRLISKESESLWLGQLGNEAQVFDGKTGKFPSDKVTLAEDLYI